MHSKLAFIVLPMALLLASLAPDTIGATGQSATQEIQQPAGPAPDPMANRPADSKSASPYMQVPEHLQNLQPQMPPPRKEGPFPTTIQTVVYDKETGQLSVEAPMAPAADASPEVRRTEGFSGVLTSEQVAEDLLVTPNSVIGPDDRVHITDVTSFPWRTVVYIALNWGGGFTSWCTGAMIDPYHVLTAGHCVSNGAGTWVSDVLIYPGRNQSYTPYHLASWTYIRSYTNWTNSGDWNHDWAVITLDRNIGNFTGWMGRITVGCSWWLSYCDGLYLGTWNNAGYGEPAPGGGANNGRMFFDADSGNTANEFKHWYWMDTEGGNSGGPVWKYYADTGNRYIGTVHAYANGGSGNSGTRLNQDKYDRINTWIGDDNAVRVPVDRADLIDDGQPWIYGFPSTVTRGVTSMSVGSDVRNVGTAGSGGFWVQYVLSSNTTITTSDYHVCYAFVSNVSSFTWANSDCSGTPAATVPAGLYYLGVIIDPFAGVSEFVENNNTAYASFQVNVVLPTVGVVASDPTATESGPTTGAFTFTRSGLASSPGNAAALTVSYSLGGSATNSIDYNALSGTVIIPAGSTSATVIVTPKPDALVETETVVATVMATAAYNVGAPASATVTISDGPDLTISNINAPATGGAGASINITAVTANIGNGAAGASTTRLYFSSNQTVEATDLVIGSLGVPVLGPSATSSGALSYTVPAGTVNGTYYIIAVADVLGAVAEGKENNNTKVKKIAIGPDLTIAAMSAPSSAPKASTITVNETTKNAAGASPAGPSTTRIYLSIDKKFDATDTLLSSRPVPGLNANGSSAFAHTVTLPAGVTGVRYLVAVADATKVVAETKESNNSKAKEVTITP